RDRRVQVLEQPHVLVAAGCRPAVARELDEVDLVHDREGAREVGCEEEGALQGRDEQRLETLVVGGNLGAELCDAQPDLLRREVGLADLEPFVYCAKSSRNRWARRSMSRR